MIEEAKQWGIQALEFESKGKFQDAKTAYLKALSIDRTSLVRLRNYALLLEQMQEYDEARLIYEEAIALKPNDCQLLADLGDLYETLHNQDKAVELYEKVLEIDPTHALANCNYSGILYFRAKESKNVKLVQKGIELLESIQKPDGRAKNNLQMLKRLLKLLKDGSKFCQYLDSSRIPPVSATIRVLLEEGVIIRTVNLQTAIYNNLRGKIIGRLNENGRYPVTLLLSDSHQEKNFLFKPENLVPIEEVEEHFGFWGCSECGAQCTCYQTASEIGHAHDCNHYMNTLRRKGPDCPGFTNCVWMECCFRKEYHSICQALHRYVRRLPMQYRYPEKTHSTTSSNPQPPPPPASSTSSTSSSSPAVASIDSASLNFMQNLNNNNNKKNTKKNKQQQTSQTYLTIKQLTIGKTHENQILQGIIDEDPFKINAIQLILRDSEGSRINVSVYNYPGYGGTSQVSSFSDNPHPFRASIFQKGQTIAIQNPYCKIAMDGRTAVRVDDFATVSIVG
jgi:hypothetical protein